MKSFTLSGKVVFQNISGGCWGIEDAQGRAWRPVNMPEQLKRPGAQVRVSARKVREDFSIFMWGEPVEILSFES